MMMNDRNADDNKPLGIDGNNEASLHGYEPEKQLELGSMDGHEQVKKGTKRYRTSH